MYPSRNHITLSSLFYALSHPTRIMLLLQLIENDEVPYNFLRYTGSKPNLSHHLKILKQTGLTYTRKEGVKRYIILRRNLIDDQFPGLLQIILNNKDNIH
ncbi:ArsR family transcriptional regulator [Priestia megaterium]|uniref:ArsR/SmtB family transcription factor n=2 Tax=Priestia megaterium TaxID=1404 RepID=UPI0030085B27